MDYKTGKLMQIVKEWEAKGLSEFEIAGSDAVRSVFFYREKSKKFVPIPKGSYTTTKKTDTVFEKLIITDRDIQQKAVEYQVCYIDNQISSQYLEEYPELEMLVSKYNEVVLDIRNIIDLLKTTGIKSDTLQMTQILTKLQKNTFWYLNEKEELDAFPIGDLNDRYNSMLEQVKTEAEKKIKEVYTVLKNKFDVHAADVSKGLDKKNQDIASGLINLQNTLSDILNELAESKKTEIQTETNVQISKIQQAVNDFIDLNKEKLRGKGITSITTTGETVAINYEDGKQTTFTVPTIPGKDAKEIENFTINGTTLKLVMKDKTEITLNVADTLEPAINKKSGFNLEKTDLRENDTTKLITAKGAFNLETDLKKEIDGKIKKSKNGDLLGFINGTNGVFLSSGNTLNFSSLNNSYHFNYHTFPNSKQIGNIYFNNGDAKGGMADIFAKNIVSTGGRLEVDGTANGSWSNIVLRTKDGAWKLEVPVESNSDENRRANLLFRSSSGEETYIRIPPAKKSGEVIAYQDWVKDGVYGQLIGGSYSAVNGGKQPPRFVADGRARFLMSNEVVNGDTSFKDWLYMNNYTGNSIGYVTAIGVGKNTGNAIKVFAMRGEKNGTSWIDKVELYHTGNLPEHGKDIIYNTKNGSTVVNVTLSKYTHFIVSAIDYKDIECPAVIPAITGSYLAGSSIGDSWNDFFVVKVESTRLSITSVKNFTNKFTKVIGFY